MTIRGEHRWGMLALSMACIGSLSCSEERDVDLLIDIRTDLVAGTEFSRIRVERFDQVPAPAAVALASHVLERAVRSEEDFLRRVRAAEFTKLNPGNHVVRARLIGSQNEIVLERIAILSLRRTSVFTLVMTRDCRGKMCPGPEDDPSLIACVGGRCVRPECAPEALEFCPSFSCEVGINCLAAACASPECTTEGICLRAGDDSRCGPGEWCDPDTGCRPLVAPTDAGSVLVDGGADAGCLDGGCPASFTPWGEWVASLGLAACPVAPELVVDDVSDDLTGGTTLDDPANAGPTLSLPEALWIATNRAGPDSIVFDQAVFPVDSPSTILIANSLALPASLSDTCIDGRNRGVVVDFESRTPCRSCIWGVGPGSFQVGLTFLHMPLEPTVRGGVVAGIRFNTDGFTEANGPITYKIRARAGSTIGPGNVFTGASGLLLEEGDVAIVGNFFGGDPVTGLAGGPSIAFFFSDLATNTNVVRVQDNELQGLVLCQRSDAQFVLTGNRGALSWTGTGTVAIGPDNLFTQLRVVDFSGQPAAFLHTQNRIVDPAMSVFLSYTPGPPNPPTIDTATTVGADGTCAESGEVELYAIDGSNTTAYLATLPCDSGTGWSYSGSLTSGQALTATLTVVDRTSVFASAVSVP